MHVSVHVCVVDTSSKKGSTRQPLTRVSKAVHTDARVSGLSSTARSRRERTWRGAPARVRTVDSGVSREGIMGMQVGTRVVPHRLRTRGIGQVPGSRAVVTDLLT